MKKYFSVRCKCGHTGSRHYYIPIDFAVKASDAKEAAKEARWIGRVKHHQKDCIQGVTEISYKEYCELYERNRKDPYLRCSSIQEQSKYDIKGRFVPEPEAIDYSKKVYQDPIQQKYDGKNKIRKPKRYIRNYLQLELSW